MRSYKSLVNVVLYSAVFAGSLVLSGCGHGHSHNHGSHSHGSHSHGHSDHSHGEHLRTPHDGVLTPLFDSTSQQVGHVELKLHDDKGDLELWLTALPSSTPFDIPLGSKIKVTFIDLENKEVLLKPRNKVNNEDENGNGNIRNDKTNYFIFPGDTKESASFLVGKSFSSKVLVSFVVNGQLFKTTSFVLKPHTH